MQYFAGPIELSNGEVLGLLLIFAVVALIGLSVFALLGISIFRTFKVRKQNRQRGGDKTRFHLTVTMPVLTVISFFLWLFASMYTQNDRYTQGALNVSSVLAVVFWGLLAASIVAGVVYMVVDLVRAPSKFK